MMQSTSLALSDTHFVDQAIAAACDSVAPTWPLDQMIAVNPYWGRIHEPFCRVAESLAELAGSPLSMPMSYYRVRWQRGDIRSEHLAKALEEQASGIPQADLIAALSDDSDAPVPVPLLCDTLDSQRDLQHEPAWCDTITHQVAQFCAAYFDQHQADWHPDRTQSLYASWRKTLSQDHSVALLMKSAQISAQARLLPEEPRTLIHTALSLLQVEPGQWSRYLCAVLMRVSGWAAWCAYRRWQARLASAQDHTLVDLLAIRLSWELLLDDGRRHEGSIWSRWQTAWLEHGQRDNSQRVQVHALWQRAHELSYQTTLFELLVSKAERQAAVVPPPIVVEPSEPEVQAVFCIDVRSEVLRRHLEAESPRIQTLGFAGFFGLPISYTPLGTQATRPQLPGLLAPAVAISDSTGCGETDQQIAQNRQRRLRKAVSWHPFRSAPASAFTLVETLGLGYTATLVKRTLALPAQGHSGDDTGLHKHDGQCLRPSVLAALSGDAAAQVDLARNVLIGMGLTSGLAPLVLLIGHGSQNQNNPQKAGLDCGACCGQTGEVNARALAELLNDAAVRIRLKEAGMQVPDHTYFIAALHNTTTDEVMLFDRDRVPASHHDALTTLGERLAAAGLAARRERAPLLGLSGLVDHPVKLTKAVRQRASDWAQTRPEWGLANNASFIVAPRARTRHLNLAGRSFLHDYDHRKDPEGRLLEQIMTAPMIVTHWINMQYYASTVDNKRYGSGNKTLHNVVGGRLGVFEGNGGDLRIGLAWQSVHDGRDWRHEPVRLTVVIDAPQAMIERVIDRHVMVKSLLDNQWLYLARWQGDSIACYRKGMWQLN